MYCIRHNIHVSQEVGRVERDFELLAQSEGCHTHARRLHRQM